MKEKSSGGLGLFTVIAVVLIILKLTGLINIAWKYIVLIWLSPVILIVVILIGLWIVRRLKNGTKLH